MSHELRRRLLTLIRLAPTFGLHDDARALHRHLALGDVVTWLLTSEYGRETLASIGGGLEVAEHMTPARTERSNDVRLAREALEEVHTLLDEELRVVHRAICGRAA